MTVGNDTIIWAKVKPDAKIPTKLDENAAYDIYACFDENEMVIPPHQTKMIPTGIASAFSNEWYIQIQERGSTGSKGIGKRCGVIDSGFRGEWFIVMTNHNPHKSIVIYKETEKDEIDRNEEFQHRYGSQLILYPYDKAIAQAVILPVPKLKEVEMTYPELLMIESERGIGSLGSSGK